jgi:histidinol-phosphate aminotransferase
MCRTARSAACRPRLPANVLLVLDAAYAEYVRRNDYSAGIELVSGHDNVVMTRTFSKIHGLAGLRIGWMYGPASVDRRAEPRARPVQPERTGDCRRRGRDPRSQAHVDEAVPQRDLVAAGDGALTDIGLKVTPSVGNFVLIHFPEGDPEQSAAKADAYLIDRGYVLRAVAGLRLAKCAAHDDRFGGSQ